jgi:hypothetical protein
VIWRLSSDSGLPDAVKLHDVLSDARCCQGSGSLTSVEVKAIIDNVKKDQDRWPQPGRRDCRWFRRQTSDRAGGAPVSHVEEASF